MVTKQAIGYGRDEGAGGNTDQTRDSHVTKSRQVS